MERWPADIWTGSGPNVEHTNRTSLHAPLDYVMHEERETPTKR